MFSKLGNKKLRKFLKAFFFDILVFLESNDQIPLDGRALEILKHSSILKSQSGDGNVTHDGIKKDVDLFQGNLICLQNCGPGKQEGSGLGAGQQLEGLLDEGGVVALEVVEEEGG